LTHATLVISHGFSILSGTKPETVGCVYRLSCCFQPANSQSDHKHKYSDIINGYYYFHNKGILRYTVIEKRNKEVL